VCVCVCAGVCTGMGTGMCTGVCVAGVRGMKGGKLIRHLFINANTETSTYLKNP